eukprot:jgi/Mesen1/10861/ME000093S10384
MAITMQSGLLHHVLSRSYLIGSVRPSGGGSDLRPSWDVVQRRPQLMSRLRGEVPQASPLAPPRLAATPAAADDDLRAALTRARDAMLQERRSECVNVMGRSMRFAEYARGAFPRVVARVLAGLPPPAHAHTSSQWDAHAASFDRYAQLSPLARRTLLESALAFFESLERDPPAALAARQRAHAALEHVPAWEHPRSNGAP